MVTIVSGEVQPRKESAHNGMLTFRAIVCSEGRSSHRRRNREVALNPPRAELIRIVETYLRTAEAGDLTEASAYLAAGAVLLFPGGVRYRDLADLYASPRRQYRAITKTLDRFDVDEADGVVAVHGTLRGENLHGVHFHSVRFIDRFEFVDGLITRQFVWNDLASTGVLTAATPGELPDGLRAA